MKKICFMLFMLCINSVFLYAQALPIEENFTFTGNLTANGWLNYPSVGVNTSFPATATVTSPLSFPNYNMSNIGGATLIFGDGEDVYKPFDAQTSGVVYASAMIKVNAASSATAGDYFFHFYGKNGAGINYQFVRFYVKDNGAAVPGFVVAVNKTTTANGATLNYAPTVFSYGTTLFVVLKYTFNTAASPDDPVLAYVFDTTVPVTEPTASGAGIILLGPVTAGATAAGDAGQLLGVSLRRNDPSMDINVDGIRVANTWAQVLPVTLTRFDVKSDALNAHLSWQVGIEKDEPVYTVQHSKDGLVFEDIHTQKSDNEHIKFEKKYTYKVSDLENGTHYFRLKMTDRAGWLDYSPIRSVQIKNANFTVRFANDELVINSLEDKNLSEPITIDVISVDGRIVKKIILSEMQQAFNFSEFLSGYYFLNCPQVAGIQGFKFFKI